MKKTLFYLAIASLSFLACSKSDDPKPEIGGSSEVSTTVFYTDSFRIYTTDLKGGNRKLLIDGKIAGNGVGTPAVLPSKQLVYIYYDGAKKLRQLKVSNFDGSNEKVIKTFDNDGSYAGFVKTFADGSIIYQTSIYNNYGFTSRTFSIKADGTGEKEIILPLYANVQNRDLISRDGKGILDETGYFAVVVNGTFDERNSFNILMNEEKDKTKIKKLTLSNDATKAAFVQLTSTIRKYEIRIKDVKKDAPATTVLYSVNINSEASDQAPDIHFVNGTKNLLVSYGKFTSPRGSVNDYTYCELLDTSNGKVTQSWKFMGDDIGHLTTD